MYGRDDDQREGPASDQSMMKRVVLEEVSRSTRINSIRPDEAKTLEVLDNGGEETRRALKVDEKGKAEQREDSGGSDLSSLKVVVSGSICLTRRPRGKECKAFRCANLRQEKRDVKQNFRRV